MITRRHPGVEARSEGGRDLVSPAALSGAGNALIVTAVIGSAALLLQLVWPWLAWGYIVAAFVLGIALSVVAARIRRLLEREVEQVREAYDRSRR